MFDDGGQFRIVNVHDVMDAGAIYTRVLHKFNITDDMEKYSMFTLSGDTGDGMSLAKIIIYEDISRILYSWNLTPLRIHIHIIRISPKFGG